MSYSNNFTKAFKGKQYFFIHYSSPLFSYTNKINTDFNLNYLTWGYSSVVEHSTADREVPGSNPGAPFKFLIKISFNRFIEK